MSMALNRREPLFLRLVELDLGDLDFLFLE